MKLNFFELAMPDYGYNFGKAQEGFGGVAGVIEGKVKCIGICL
jgi:hypothetical protein